MRTKHVIDITPDSDEYPGAVIVMTDTVEDDLDGLVISPNDSEYVFSVDGQEFTPAQFRRVLRRGIKLDELEEYGRAHRPGWKFVVGGKHL